MRTVRLTRDEILAEALAGGLDGFVARIEAIEAERTNERNKPLETPAGLLEIGPTYNVTVRRPYGFSGKDKVRTLREVTYQPGSMWPELHYRGGRTTTLYEKGAEVVAIETVRA